MELKTIHKKKLKEADEFQQKILNPQNKKRYRTFGYVKKNYLTKPELFVGAYDNNKLIGIIFGYIKRDNVLLGEMAIDENYRGIGLGSKLLDFFEKQAIRTGKNKITLGALDNAEKFYMKRGYKPILFLQIRNSDVPLNYKSLSKYKIIKETNYSDAKRLFFKAKYPSNTLKNKLAKLFHAYNAIYLFKKSLK